MRSVMQRVKRASVLVNGETVGKIPHGLLALLAVGQDDGEKDIIWTVKRSFRRDCE